MMRIALTALPLLIACAHQGPDVGRDSRRLGRAVGRGNVDAVQQYLHPAIGNRVDTGAMLHRGSREQWEKALNRPQQIREEAVVLLGPGWPISMVRTESGWRFQEDPSDIYSQATPRHALRALLLAARLERWDVLLRLAPRRYRMGLSQEDLKQAWTRGEQARALKAASDRLARFIDGEIIVDADEATLDLGQGDVARLEREDDRWVVVEF